MTNKTLDLVEKPYLKATPLQFTVGDTVDVATRIIEGEKERIQVFSGTVIMRKGRGINETFTVRRIVGGGDLWVSEFVLTYDGVPSYVVSIMEFRDGLVANETQYFSTSFDPAPSRAQLVEQI